MLHSRYKQMFFLRSFIHQSRSTHVKTNQLPISFKAGIYRRSANVNSPHRPRIAYILCFAVVIFLPPLFGATMKVSIYVSHFIPLSYFNRYSSKIYEGSFLCSKEALYLYHSQDVKAEKGVILVPTALRHNS